MMADFNISAIGVKAQRKLASSLSSRKTARLVLDERANCLLDKAFRVLLLVASSRKEAERVTKNVIKLMVKTGLLARHDQFNADEAELGRQLRSKFRCLIMAFTSFHRVDFTYERRFLLDQLDTCHRLLRAMLQGHLTEKSHARLEQVFLFFCQPGLLDGLFQAPAGSSLNLALGQLCRELDDFIDARVI